jgi:hypothetical protein
MMSKLQGYDTRISNAGQVRRVEALIRAMASDMLLREQFVTNPAQVLGNYLTGDRLPAESAEPANQLIYSIAANPDLIRWLQSYSQTQAGRVPDPHEFAVTFGRAVADNNAYEVIFALQRAASTRNTSVAIDQTVLEVLFRPSTNAGSLASATEMSTGTDFGTQRSGTEISSGPVFQPGRVFEGTEVSTGTERSGTEISSAPVFQPDRVFEGTEVSTGTDFGTERSGTEISSGPVFQPDRVFEGTEVSTGTDFGTERSGTEISSAQAAFGLLLSPAAQVVLHALADHAGTLRRRGALQIALDQ